MDNKGTPYKCLCDRAYCLGDNDREEIREVIRGLKEQKSIFSEMHKLADEKKRTRMAIEIGEIINEIDDAIYVALNKYESVAICMMGNS
jgi:hypothetical protein